MPSCNRYYTFRQVPVSVTNFSFSLTVTIGGLSEEVLLNIFCYYLDTSPRLWPRLAHICRRWRRVVFVSQRTLRLRLFCTYGTPVVKSLDCWPTLPIVVRYGGSSELDPPTCEDEDNILVALKQSDRVSSIHLSLTNSLLEKLSAIGRPVSKLEDLVLLSQDSRQTLPNNAFEWGTRLRSLHLTRIAYVALPQLLYSSRKLVDLRLHEVLSPWLLSPESLTDALSGMTLLQSLSLHLLPTTDHIGRHLPYGKRIVLPSLTRLNFRGIAVYLEDLVAGIDAPYLSDIEVTYSNEPVSDFSKLYEFIDRIQTYKSPRRADILSSEYAITISLIQPGAPTSLKFQLLCESLALQISFIARICGHFSAFIFDVEDLRISATPRQSRPADGLHSEAWLEPLNSFTGVKWLHISGELYEYIVRSLEGAERPKTVFPAMHKLYIPEPGSRDAPLSEAVVSLMTSRRLSGHPFAVEYERQYHTGITYAKHYHPYSLTHLE